MITVSDRSAELRHAIEQEKTSVPDRGDDTPISKMADSYRRAGIEERGQWLYAVREIVKESYLLSGDEWIALVRFIELASLSVDNLSGDFVRALRNWPTDANLMRLSGVTAWLAAKNINIPIDVFNFRCFSKLKEQRPWPWIDAMALHDLGKCAEVIHKLLSGAAASESVARLRMRLDAWRRARKGEAIRSLCQDLLQMKPPLSGEITLILREAVGTIPDSFDPTIADKFSSRVNFDLPHNGRRVERDGRSAQISA